MILAAMPLVSGIVAPFWGMLADRFGRRIMLQRSLFGFAVCLGAMGLATEPWHLLAIRAVEGLFGGFMASAAALISTTSPPERVSIGIGRTHAARVLGMAAGPIPGGLMADYAGYRPACFAAMAFAFAAFVIVTLFTRETVRRALKDATTEIVSLRRVITSGAFLSVFGAILVTRMAERTFDPVLPLLVAQTTDGTAVASATSAIAASGLLASGVAAAVIGHLVAGKASRTLFILLVLTAAAFAPIAFIPGWWRRAAQPVFADLSVFRRQPADSDRRRAVHPRAGLAGPAGMSASVCWAQRRPDTPQTMKLCCRDGPLQSYELALSRTVCLKRSATLRERDHMVGDRQC